MKIPRYLACQVPSPRRLPPSGRGSRVASPGGDEKNFQGTGDTDIVPLLYASTPPVSAARSIRLQAYVNAGIGVNASDLGRSEGRYGVGLDCHVGDRFTAAAAVLGRNPFERQSPPGVFDLRRCSRRDASGGRCVRADGEELPAPFLGLRGGRPDFYDLSVGARVSLWRDRLLGFVDAILPVNADGFRADVIPLVGIEMTF